MSDEAIPNPTTLSLTNQVYCKTYFSEQSYNLMMNRAAEHDLDWGWAGQFYFKNSEKAVNHVDSTLGQPELYLQLISVAKAHTQAYIGASVSLRA